MVSRGFWLALAVRSTTLLLPQTYFQPDEFYQALEPAHWLVFGFGHLTWEWKDLPRDVSVAQSWWEDYVVGGRMRSWLWPIVFAGGYKVLQSLNLDQTLLLTLLPRLICLAVAALTDYMTSRLATKLLGPGAAAGAMFLSLTSLFNAHLLPRALSTSPETLLTTMALYYFPLDQPTAPSKLVVGPKGVVVDTDLQDVSKASEKSTKRAEFGAETKTLSVRSAAELNHVMMDRMKPTFKPEEASSDNLFMSISLATLAMCIRPTTLPLWAFLGLHLVWRRLSRNGSSTGLVVVMTAVSAMVGVGAFSTALDYAVTGRLYIPMLTFIHRNVIRSISTFYGATDPTYHLVQSLPIMLFPVWWWWGQGFLACLLPSRLLPSRLAALDCTPGMIVLARALAFTVFALSFSPHSEWRFLHPLLPSLLLFALPPVFQAYTPVILGAYRLVYSIRQYTRFSKLPFYLCLLAPLLPYLYLNTVHGQAQVDVMNVLQRGEVGDVSSLVALMPCHSTPWMSHLHQDIPGWFLTCEPPLVPNTFDHVTQQSLFYKTPVSYLRGVFPHPPVPLHQITKTTPLNVKPSHLILFGEVLSRTETTDRGEVVSVEQALQELEYEPVWYRWNGFDLVQDEAERRGGVHIWRLRHA